MNLFLASGYSVMNLKGKEKELFLKFKVWKRLVSFFDLERGNKIMNVINLNMVVKKVNLFLDSGAFSAKSQGISININEYIDFIKENIDYINVYANLDVIGDAEATWKNQKIMEKAGLSPIPVYHYGEDIKWLERYLSKGYDYIALGGLTIGSTVALVSYLDRLFKNYICDAQGIPKIKVHGFGLTNLKCMLRYPWYSVDSTSWVVTGRMGSIFIPRYRNGDWIYDEQSLKIAVSTKSPSKKDAGQHIDTLSTKTKSIILDYIHNKGYVLGKSEYKKEKQSYELKENEKWSEKKPKDRDKLREVEIIIEPGISNIYQLRDELNIIYFLDLEKSMPSWPWAFKKGQDGLIF